ncbi:MAG: acyl-CoA synthetase, partial [Pseudomonadota bacterium]
ADLLRNGAMDDQRFSLADYGPPPPCPAQFNLARYVLAAGDDDKVALTIVDENGPVRLTYADLRRRVSKAAGALLAAGVKPGERIVLRIGHDLAFPIAFLAAAGIGAVPVPTSTLLSASELRHIIEDTSAVLAITSEELNLPCPTIRPDALNGVPAHFADTSANDLAYIIYTSGSAGRPKGVAHAHRAVWARRMMWDGWYGLTSSDVMLHAGAFNWTYTLGAGLMDPWAIGASTLIWAGQRNPGVWPDLARDYGATIFAAAPGVYRQLLTARDDLSGFAGLRHGLCAGETFAPMHRDDWNSRTGKPIYEALGMTEISTFLSSSPDHPHVEGKAGRPQPGRKIALIANETPAPLGEEGVIAVDRSDPGLMLGYWNDEAATEAAMTGDWFLTGDVGTMDEEGYITFLGRNDDMMNALGYRVAPEEVEAALNLHPGVAAAAAVELQVRQDLSLIAAFIQPADDPPDEASLAAHAQEHLGAYKIPRVWKIIDQLPRNPNGKLRRKALRDQYGWKAQ